MLLLLLLSSRRSLSRYPGSISLPLITPPVCQLSLQQKSDARNSSRQSNAPAVGSSSAPPFQQHFQHHQPQHPLLALPNITVGDEFRSSVIIPECVHPFIALFPSLAHLLYPPSALDSVLAPSTLPADRMKLKTR